MTDWEGKFRAWARPPSDAEQQRCERTVREIRAAIANDALLQKRNVHVFVQGSYRNNTNVRRDSDVDVGVVCFDTFFYDNMSDQPDDNLGFGPPSYTYESFKVDVGRALTAHFENGAVTRGNKAFDIKSSRNQVEADVAPFFQHRRYSAPNRFISGVELRPDDGRPPKIINWPEHHYENGVAKNNRTGHRYKGFVRVLKSLRNEMSDAGYEESRPIIGFLSECLVWNVPDDFLCRNTYLESFRLCLAHLIDCTGNDQRCGEWGEVSELKYLFRGSQKWSRDQAYRFLVCAWNYVGY